jgi:hypothetical protein
MLLRHFVSTHAHAHCFVSINRYFQPVIKSLGANDGVFLVSPLTIYTQDDSGNNINPPMQWNPCE